jgi:hypothetical protein
MNLLLKKIFLCLIATTLFTQFSYATDCENEEQTGVSVNECYALLDFFWYADGFFWNNSTNWYSYEPIDSWYGVTVEDNSVVEINLPNNNLYALGAFEIYFEFLPNLRVLVLKQNQLDGTLEPFMSLSNLEELDLSQNSYSGSIPETISNLSNLKLLNVSDNQLDGSIPSSIGEITSLEKLYIFSNEITGSIPETFANLVNINVFHAVGNYLTGNVTADMFNFVLDSNGESTLWLSNNCLQISDEDLSALNNDPNISLFYIDAQNNNGCPDVVQNHPADLDGDGIVSINDILLVLSFWGATNHPYDIDGDGIVGVTDVLFVISFFGDVVVGVSDQPTTAIVTDTSSSSSKVRSYSVEYPAQIINVEVTKNSIRYKTKQLDMTRPSSEVQVKETIDKFNKMIEAQRVQNAIRTR